MSSALDNIYDDFDGQNEDEDDEVLHDEDDDDLINGDSTISSEADFSLLSSIHLKDYTNLTSNNFPDLESSPFAKVMGSDGRSRIVKKSTLLWLLENSVKKLSNDRRLRVMQTVSFTEQNKLIIKHVSKRGKVQIGDWCIFKCSDGLSFMLGRVLSFAFEENAAKSIAIWEWDMDSVKNGAQNVGALCAWYEVEVEENKLTGFLYETDKFTHGFYSISNYVCSCPPPQFISVNDEVVQLSFSNSTIIELSKMLLDVKLLKNIKRY